MKKNSIIIILTIIIVVLISIITLMYFGIIKTSEKDCNLNNDSNNNQVSESNNQVSESNNQVSDKCTGKSIVTVKGDKYIPTNDLLDLIGIEEIGLPCDSKTNSKFYDLTYFFLNSKKTNGDVIINELPKEEIDYIIRMYAINHKMTVVIDGEKITEDYCKSGSGRCTVTNEGVFNFIAQKFDIKKTADEIYGSDRRYKDYLILYPLSGSVGGMVETEESIVFEYIGDEILATYNIKIENNELDYFNINKTIKYYFKRINQDYFDNNEWALYKYNVTEN